MGLKKFIISRKLLLINLIFAIYVATNLIGGERGIVSYFEKNKDFHLEKNKTLELIKNETVNGGEVAPTNNRQETPGEGVDSWGVNFH